jgi:exosortase
MQVAIISLLLVVVYLEPLRSVLAKWMNDPNWSHGWLIPAFSLYFLYLRRNELRAMRAEPNYGGVAILVGALAAYFIFAWAYPFAYPQALTLFVAIYGLMLLLGGWNLVRAAWFPVFFLLLSVPIPDRIYVEITRPLREIASKVSAAALPFLVPGLHADAQAVVIDYMLPGGAAGQLNVEEACSGMRLMMAFVTLGIAMAYLGQRPLWQRLFGGLLRAHRRLLQCRARDHDRVLHRDRPYFAGPRHAA